MQGERIMLDVGRYTIGTMKMGRRRFLKSLALAGAIATMGFSGCVSPPEPTPAPLPTPKPPAAKPTQTSNPTTKEFTESKPCPACATYMYLEENVSGALLWVCENDECGYVERVSEPEILRKYGYMS